MTAAHEIRNGGSNGDLDPFHGIHDQESQFTVKDVGLKNLVKGRSREKTMSGITRNLKGQKITGKPVISYKPEVVQNAALVPDDKASFLEKTNEAILAQGRFFKGIREWLSGHKKNPPRCASRERRGGDCYRYDNIPASIVNLFLSEFLSEFSEHGIDCLISRHPPPA
jgi:hypothetical protein